MPLPTRDALAAVIVASLNENAGRLACLDARQAAAVLAVLQEGSGSLPSREALVAEAEKVNAERTDGPWVVLETPVSVRSGGIDSTTIERRIITGWDHPQLKGPEGVVNIATAAGTGEKLVSIDEADAAFIAFCGTHMTTLLSLLASEGEKVKKLEAKYTPLYQGLLTSAVALLDAGYKGDGIPDGIKWLKADRDRLAAEVERLKAWQEEATEVLTKSGTERGEAAKALLKAEADVTRLTAQWEALKAWHLNQVEVWDAAGSPEHAATHHAAIKSMAELEAQR